MTPTPKKSKSPKKTARPKKAATGPRKRRSTQEPLVLGYDLGGTKVAIGVVDLKGNILASHREPVLFKHGKDATLKQLIQLGKRFIREYPSITQVGIASAGPLDPVEGKLLDPTNFNGPDGHWGVVPLADILSKGLKRPVTLENDAAAAMLAEVWKGQAQGYKNALILTLGTGLGTGIVCNGELLRAGRHMHTEAGHMVIQAYDKSALCGCGNYGCAEAYLAGKAFTLRARRQLKNDQIDAPQVAARARRGEPQAAAMFTEYAKMLAITLHNFAVMYCPEIIILTGSFAAASDLYIENTLKELELLLERRNKVMNLTPIIKVSSLENQAGVLGGAYVAVLAHERSVR